MQFGTCVQPQNSTNGPLNCHFLNFPASGAVNRRLSSTGNVPRIRNRSASMDEYDQPVGVKNLLFDNTRRYSKATDIPGISEVGDH